MSHPARPARPQRRGRREGEELEKKHRQQHRAALLEGEKWKPGPQNPK